MTRIRGDLIPPKDIDLTFDLILGPTEGWVTEEQLELAWGAYGEEMMRHNGAGRSRPGMRPWAYWKFELGEEQPENDQEAIRLAELGLLRDDEIATIAERANEARMRVGTAAEHRGPNCHPDRDAVELHEAVKRARMRE